jgi:tripartite-type tricarboxylate transporter receptor subunit TctC
MLWCQMLRRLFAAVALVAVLPAGAVSRQEYQFRAITMLAPFVIGGALHTTPRQAIAVSASIGDTLMRGAQFRVLPQVISPPC